MTFLDISDDEDILTIKRKNIDIDDIPMIESEDKKPSKKKKPITKVALAKKVLKKKIVPNKKTMFDDEGQVRIILCINISLRLAKIRIYLPNYFFSSLTFIQSFTCLITQKYLCLRK